MGWPDRTERSFGRTLRHALFAALLPIALPIPTLAQAGQAQIFPTAPLPTAEFDAPYAIDVLSGGEIIQISGSFSWAMPQNFIAALAGAPHVRTIRFDSPGGHVQAALQIADVIHDRGLDTYVPRFCASACTLAFLAGKHRFLAPTAQLGFHQAHAPGVAPEIFDPVLRAVYGALSLPPAFIDHALRTPPTAIWFPTPSELRAARITTANPPASLIDADDAVWFAWQQAIRLAPATPDATVVSIADVFSAMLGQLQTASPESCWGYFHNMPTNLRASLQPPMLQTMVQVEQQVREASQAPGLPLADTAARAKILRSLFQTIRTAGNGQLLQALRLDGDHAGFCPAIRALLAAAQALPEARRGNALRALLVGI